MDLRQFRDVLVERGLLARVGRPVDVMLEVAAVAGRLGERPVLFENVRGFSMPVISGVCATRDLACLGMGIERRDLIAALAAAADHPVEPGVVPAGGYAQVDVDLGSLPVLTCTPRDGGPYIASGIVVARDPEHGLNASFHRAMVIGRDRLVLRVVERHLHEYMRRGLREFALCIGNPVQVLVAAAMSVELGRSELSIANALAPTRLVEIGGHVVPEAEIVMICELTGEQADEGPFLDLTGTFDIVRKQPVVRVREIHVREGALFHALLPGGPEHRVLMGMPREPTIFREVSRVCECLDVRVTPGGCSWLHVAVRIAKRAPDDGPRAIEAALRGHPSAKHVFVVDADIDIDDPAAIEWAMATRFQADRGLVVLRDQQGSSLDPSSDPATRRTSKLGFDLTVPDGARAGDFERASPPLDVEPEDYL